MSSSAPPAVAKAFGDRLGLTTVYIADLDAITGAPSDGHACVELAELGLHLWIDSGLRSPADAHRAREAGAEVVIADLETVPSPECLAAMVEAVGWRFAFAALAIGPFLGVWAMARLRARPESVRLAGGRR